MTFLSIIRRLLSTAPRRPEGELPPSPSDADAPRVPTEQEIFHSPKMLADWVGQYILSGLPLEKDYALVPDAETRASLEITPDQRDRCLREYSVLRIAGVSLFIKQHQPDEFWLAFMDYVLPLLVRHMESTGHSVDRSETRNALEEYVHAGEAKDPDRCAIQYMTRLYDDHPKYIRMKLSGIGHIASDQLLSSYEVFRDTHCRVTQGMPYESFVQITKAMEKVSRGEA